MSNKKDTKAALNRGIFPVIVMVIVTVVCTGLLALTNGITTEARAEQKVKKVVENRQLLFPEAKEFKELDVKELLSADIDEKQVSALAEAKNEAGETIGYIAETNARGYGGAVNIMLAIGTNQKLVGLRIMDNSETAGLGKKVEGESFRSQFKDLDATKRYTARSVEGKEQIDAISGATISSNAVAEAINVALDLWQQAGGAH